MKFTDIQEASLQSYARARQHIETNSRYQKIKEFTLTHFLKKYFIAWIVLWVLAGYLYNIGGKTTSTSSVTEYIVGTGTITNTIKAYGSAELVDEQQLRFNQQGDVTAVYFKKGDEVKKWDIIAELDTKSLENNITQAEISLADAQLQLNDVLAWNTETQILQAENNLEQSKLKLNITQKEYDNMVKDLNSSWAANDTITTYKSTFLDIQEYMAQWERMLIDFDKIFWASSKYSSINNWFELYLSAKNTKYKENTSSFILLWYKNLNELQSTFNNLSWDFGGTFTGDRSKNDLLILLNLCNSLYDSIYKASDTAFYALENSIPNVSYNQSDDNFDESVIENFKSTVVNEGNKAKSSLSTILSAENKLTNLTNTDDTSLTLQSKANDIENLKNTIIIQQKTLDETKKWNTEIQIAQAKNNVRQKELALETAKDNKSNYQIEAPFDGTIRKIDFQVGDKLTSSEEKYVYLENPNLVEISITLDQVDVVNVKAGMTVEVTMDAYPWVIFEWVLGDIDSTPVISNGVTSYTVKVAIDKWEKIIYSGMTATVKIIIENREGVITIPTTFIQSKWDKKYDLDNKDNQIDITVWSTDWTMTEVISWLTVGDSIKKTITATSSTTKNSSFRGMESMWGGMWGGGWWGMPPG